MTKLARNPIMAVLFGLLAGVGAMGLHHVYHMLAGSGNLAMAFGTVVVMVLIGSVYWLGTRAGGMPTSMRAVITGVVGIAAGAVHTALWLLDAPMGVFNGAVLLMAFLAFTLGALMPKLLG